MKNMLDLQVLRFLLFSDPTDRFVKGLEHCLKEAASLLPCMDTLKFARIKKKGKRLFSSDNGGSYEVWDSRPLHPDLLEYAANDVEH
eukprot:7236933-Prymnesium_polylepis.1